jgi:hypothetical protein
MMGEKGLQELWEKRGERNDGRKGVTGIMGEKGLEE